MRAVARRKDLAPRTRLACGALNLELEPLRLVAPNGPVDVPRRELAVLAALIEAQGAPVSKAQLLDRVYGVGSETDDKVIEVYVSRLRKRLAPHDIGVRVIRSIGYALLLPAE